MDDHLPSSPAGPVCYPYSMHLVRKHGGGFGHWDRDGSECIQGDNHTLYAVKFQRFLMII